MDDGGEILARRNRGAHPPMRLQFGAVVEAIQSGQPSPDEIVALWSLFTDEASAGLVKLPLIMALAAKTDTPSTREAMWSELSELTKPHHKKGTASRALLTLFERRRADLLPLLPPIQEEEGGGDEMARLMTSSRVFGDDIWQSLFDMVQRNPAAVARLIERERERGRPVEWEYQGFEGMMRWKARHLVSGAPEPPRTLAELDAASETFVSIFNALHSLDEWYRSQMLRGLGPIEVFNAAVGGERELYRLGTSGYRGFLHPVILSGIKASGSFETFLQKAAPSWLGEAGPDERTRRGMRFLRIASSFGLLDSVLALVSDRERFVTDALAALGDPRAFEGSSTIVLDVLTAPAATKHSGEFKQALLGRLYETYRVETDVARRSVYGSMLAAYQAVTGDRREPSIEQDFALDRSLLHLPHERLFSAAGRGLHVHRMFMRMHDDIDARVTSAGFRRLMRKLGASVSDRRRHTVYKLYSRGHRIEIYVNHPSQDGIRQGIADIGKELGNDRLHTLIGRGHTGIIVPLQADAKRLLGDRVKTLAVGIVGTCGGDASARELIGTFGYLPIVATRSTGRQVLNNAIVSTYIKDLLDMRRGETLSMIDVVKAALLPFTRKSIEEELREDAKMYRVNVAVAIASRLFDTHVAKHTQLQLTASVP